MALGLACRPSHLLIQPLCITLRHRSLTACDYQTISSQPCRSLLDRGYGTLWRRP